MIRFPSSRRQEGPVHGCRRVLLPIRWHPKYTSAAGYTFGLLKLSPPPWFRYRLTLSSALCLSMPTTIEPSVNRSLQCISILLRQEEEESVFWDAKISSELDLVYSTPSQVICFVSLIVSPQPSIVF
ncbi:hypothetical protein D1007_37194 [Hordeum vulgare]|nr:hypothetical protein D1007_37194 [Hordeum vulgare]